MRPFMMRSGLAISCVAIIAISGIVLSVSDCSFPPPARVPHITSLSPSSTTAGDPAFTLIVIGTGFDSSSTVSWNHSVRNTMLQSPTSVVATISASDIASSGVATVTVINFGGSGAVTSNPLDFAIN